MSSQDEEIKTLLDSTKITIIDSPPSHEFFNQDAIAVSSVMLMQSRYNGIASFKNTASAITKIFGVASLRDEIAILNDS